MTSDLGASAMRLVFLRLLKYGMTGLLNTAVTLTLIYTSIAIGLSDVAANAIGYAVGICISFFMNNKWTFAQDQATLSQFLRFLAVAGCAYAVNLWVLLTARDVLHIDHRICHLLGAVAYTGVGFIGTSLFVFRSKSVKPNL